HRSVKLGEDFLGRQVACGRDELLKAAGTKLLPSRIFPLQEAVCDEKDDVAFLHGYDLGRVGGQSWEDAQRNVVRRKCLHTATGMRITEKRAVAGGQKFELVVSRVANGGNEGSEPAGREIFSEGFVDVLQRVCE